MSATNQNSPEPLCAEILAHAQRECDEILHHAAAEAEAILAAASVEAETILRETLDRAQIEAARRKELILATVAVETARLRSARVESLLESVREEIRRRLLARNFAARETIVALAAEAIRQMPGNGFSLKISAADHAAFGNGLPDEISQRAGRSSLSLVISSDAAMTDGGVIVQTADGLQLWDNHLLSRLERLGPELRRPIAVRTSLVSDQPAAGGGA
jgi:vacuolar-type H+-ATPase subunit E/Vma4